MNVTITEYIWGEAVDSITASGDSTDLLGAHSPLFEFLGITPERFTDRHLDGLLDRLEFFMLLKSRHAMDEYSRPARTFDFVSDTVFPFWIHRWEEEEFMDMALTAVSMTPADILAMERGVFPEFLKLSRALLAVKFEKYENIINVPVRPDPPVTPPIDPPVDDGEEEVTP